MWLAASAERTGGASAVEASGPESVRSSLSWVHFVLDSPSKVLFHPVRVGFSGYGGGFSGERREQTGGLQRLRRRASRVRSSLSWVHLFWTLPPKFFSLRFGGLGQRERGSAERQRRRRANSEASAWLQRLERRRVRSSLSWVHLFWTPPPKFFSIRYGRGQGLRGDLGFSGLWRQVRVCPERSVLGTFVLDSPSKVPFTSVREGGFSGKWREQTGGLQRLWRRVLVCAERSVLGTFCSGLSLQSSFLLVLGAQCGYGRLRLQRGRQAWQSAEGAGSGVCPERSVLGTFVLDSPSKVLFHPVRAGPRGLQSLRQWYRVWVRSRLSWVHLFWTLPPKIFSPRFGGPVRTGFSGAER